MKKNNKIILTVFLLFSVTAGVFITFDGAFTIYKPFHIDQVEYYILPKGGSVNSVAHDLFKQGKISRRFYLVLFARLSGISAKLKAGEYLIEPGMSAVDLLTKMTNGEVVLHTLTLVEGWSFKQILNKLNENDVLIKQLNYDQNLNAIVAQLGFPDNHPEGRIYPDTYSFPRGTTDIEFLQRAWKVMDTKLDLAWQTRDSDLPFKTPYEALILASIIQKEAGNNDEMPMIASVFVNRLRRGMRLQADPTIIYGMGDSYDGDIRFRDIKTDTPYNTYTRKGLTPTPIAMPGLQAIESTLHPLKSEMIYFVARGDGTHKFSSTLQEHEKAVDLYQRRRK